MLDGIIPVHQLELVVQDRQLCADLLQCGSVDEHYLLIAFSAFVFNSDLQIVLLRTA